ncbi:hypothetical protein A0H76_566 [Hepatospora eriocheir]|uniref:Integrase catalytic domain-containing protein n=1 Tax=Hepatospora eriocheir TaxID=1081669 RepID=A0A1X0Q871_9MICR|nr:hypothetical protein A0H76_566 [Hepatospora eriocheir]
MRLTAPYSSWSNGKAERTNQTIIAKLAKIIVNEKDWDDMLSIAIYHYQISPKEKLKASPFELLYGKKPYINKGNQYAKVESEAITREEQLQLREAKYLETVEHITQVNQKYVQLIEKRNEGKTHPEQDLKEGVLCMYKNRDLNRT